MAIFGLQIVLSLIVFCILTKLTKYYSIGRWLLCKGLYRYWPPTNDEFKTAIKQRYKEPGKIKKSNNYLSSSYQQRSSKSSTTNNTDQIEEFNIPNDISLELKLIPLVHRDVIQVKYADEFFSLIDFSSASIFIFILTELYMWLVPIIRGGSATGSVVINELNLSLLWCTISIVLCVWTLLRIVRQYLKSDEGSLCVIFGTLSFLISMCIQYFDEKIFHINLKETYGNISNITSQVYKVDIDDDGDVQKQYLNRNFIYIVVILSLFSSLLSVILFFPAFRFGQIQQLFIKKPQTTIKQRLILLLTIINFVLPLFICLLWLKPITKTLQLNVFSKIATEDTVIDERQLSRLKIVLTILSIAIRLLLFKLYIQTYLDTAYDRVKCIYEQQQQQTNNTARITNITYQRNVTSIFLYLGVIACNLILPIFIQLFICFLYKVLGNVSWITNLPSSLPIQQSSPASLPLWLQQLDTYVFSNTTTNSTLSFVTTWNELKTLVSSQYVAVIFSYFLFCFALLFKLGTMRSLTVDEVRRRYNRQVLFCMRIKGAAIFVGLWDLMIHTGALFALMYMFLRMPTDNSYRVAPMPTRKILTEPIDTNSVMLTKIMDARRYGPSFTTADLYTNLDYMTFKWSRSLSQQDKCIVFFVTLSATVVTLAALYGVLTSKPSYIVPYFLIKVFNVIVSVLTMLGFYAYLPDITMWIRMQPNFPFKQNLLELGQQTLQLVLFAFLLFIVLAKLYIAAVVWYAYGYITALNVARSTGTTADDETTSAELYSPPKYEEAIKQEHYYSVLPPPPYQPLLTS
ncbi:unnamed protein product [Didymodactylos carnosus]|uniref:Uncharacterized protein n=1 Tax=Didymodactylos carnosus TaxID=1234261 RepID=A0A813PEH9_9BILA|nr:unnamed protein product [Didymodactylos carnosus]CAF0956653.1 unnamed protein product [Didymodactylos carnosus]CAF3532935.1 unnamed protein product [Didymodactylos carnosus]CAF3729827.1 unnamed protein product [Didymodactylos carnosus]